MIGLIIFIIFGVFFVQILRSVRVVREGQRMTLLRLGKFNNLLSPGLHIIVPFIEKTSVIDLNAEMPGYKGLSSEQIGDKIVEDKFGRETLAKWVNNGRRPMSFSKKFV